MGELQDERLAHAKAVALTVDDRIEYRAENIARISGRHEEAPILGELIDRLRIDARLARQTALQQLGGGDVFQMAYYRMEKTLAKLEGVANCGEYASYVMWRLYKQGVFPIHLISVEKVKSFRNHAFVAIGLSDVNPRQDMENWEDQEVAICDPWLGQLIRAVGPSMKSKMGDKSNNKVGAFRPLEYKKLTWDLFDKGTIVQIEFGLTTSAGNIPKLPVR